MVNAELSSMSQSEISKSKSNPPDFSFFFLFALFRSWSTNRYIVSYFVGPNSTHCFMVIYILRSFSFGRVWALCVSWITYDPTYIKSMMRHLKFIWNLHNFCIILFILWVVLNVFKSIRCFSRVWVHFRLCFFNIHCITVVEINFCLDEDIEISCGR